MVNTASYRKRYGLTVPADGYTHNARMVIPADVRAIVASLPDSDVRKAAFMRDGKPKTAFVKTTSRRHPEEARAIGEAMQREWKAMIASLRADHKPDGVVAARDAIDRWREDRVARAQGFEVEISVLEFAARADGKASVTPGVEHGGALWAKRYFDDRPNAPKTTPLPPETYMLLDRLQAMDVSTEAWRDIEGFDAMLSDALGARPSLSTKAAMRPHFAKAWMEVIRAEEMERRYAAAILSLVERDDVMVPRRGSHQPRPGDRMLGELLKAYVAAKGDNKDYRAPMRALKEFFGDRKPIRAIGRQDARDLVAFIKRLPSNATKRFPNKSLAEAVEEAARIGAPTVSTTSVRNYVNHISMIWNWAISEREGWAEVNPFRGLSPDAEPKTRREGFQDEDLIKLFAALAPYKASDHSMFWVTALSLNGARMSELLQLRTHEVKTADGVAYLDFGEFDEDGLRIEGAQYKTRASIRTAPIHPLVIDAGFLEFVERRRAQGEARLFPEVKPREGANGKANWSHYHSKRINKIIDDHVSEAPKLVAHSFRHMLRERGLDLDIAPEILDAIGGWTPKSVGQTYGVKRIGMLHRNLARITFGALKL